MEDQFVWGALAGLAFMGVCWILEKYTYQMTLLRIATHQGREKLADGQFYYIVPESEWHRVKQEAVNNVLLFKQCERGHGQLTATNWVPQPCLVCEVQKLRALIGDDAYAASFQSLSQYRNALLRELKKRLTI